MTSHNDKAQLIASLVNALFRDYRHPSGREYTNREVVEGIAQIAGRRMIEASYLSKLRTGAVKSPGITVIEALCTFFPVEPDYFFPDIATLRRQQSNDQKASHLYRALRSTGADPKIIQEQLARILNALIPPKEE